MRNNKPISCGNILQLNLTLLWPRLRRDYVFSFACLRLDCCIEAPEPRDSAWRLEVSLIQQTETPGTLSYRDWFPVESGK